MRSELVPTITAGVLLPSGNANQLSKGFAFSLVERGLISTPPCSRDVKRYVSVVRICALGTWPGMNLAPQAQPCLLILSPPPSARPSPGQGGQEGRFGAPPRPPPPCRCFSSPPCPWGSGLALVIL